LIEIEYPQKNVEPPVYSQGSWVNSLIFKLLAGLVAILVIFSLAAAFVLYNYYYKPIHGESGAVLAYLDLYISYYELVSEIRIRVIHTLVIIVAALLAAGIAHLLIIKKYVTKPIKILIDSINEYKISQISDKREIPKAKLNRGDELASLEQAIIATEIQLLDTVSKLEEERNFINLIMDGSPIAMYMFNSDFELVYCNDIDAKLRGYECGLNFKDKFFASMPKYQPDGSESVEKFKEYLEKTFETGITNVTWMDQDSDGALVPGEITNIRVLYKGEYYIVSYKKDLRDMSKMEDKISALEKQASKIYYDELTGIFNRRHLEEQLPRSLGALSRSSASLSLMMIDVDFFKQFNDTYGHDAGDRCLKAVASTISGRMLRARDFAVRYGGEEFVVVLPYTDREGACKLAETLLESIERCEIPHEKSTVSKYVTISIGVTSGITDHKQSISDWIKSADEKLYLSKQRGRNRFTFGEFDHYKA